MDWIEKEKIYKDNYELRIYKEMAERIHKPITLEQIGLALNNINKKCKYIVHARAFIILMYYSGAHAHEVLKLTSSDITLSKDRYWLEVHFRESAKNKERTIKLRMKDPYVKEIEIIRHTFPNIRIFPMLCSRYCRSSSNDIVWSAKVRPMVRRWFLGIRDNINLNHFRYNRVRIMLEEKKSLEYIRAWLGNKSFDEMEGIRLSEATR